MYVVVSAFGVNSEVFGVYCYEGQVQTVQATVAAFLKVIEGARKAEIFGVDCSLFFGHFYMKDLFIKKFYLF